MGSDMHNKKDIKGDGTVVIHQRENRHGDIIPTWYMRIRIPLPQSKGYIRKSTNETYASALNNVLDGQAKIDNILLVEGGTSIKENMMNYHNHFYDFLKKYGSDCISFYSTDLDKLDNTSKEAVERYNKLVVKRNEASDFYNQAVPIAEKHNILGQEFIQQ